MSRLSKQTLTADEILQSTDGGKSIFEKEIGEIPKKCINSPLREDNNPSFSIFLANNGLWMYKDFSNGDSGTAIQFIQKLYDLDYNKAISYILELNINTNTTHKKLIKEQPKKLIIDWVEQKFTDQHKRYFGDYELDETFLNSRDIWALKTIAINKRIQKFPDYQFKFAYYAKDLDQIKVLTLGKEVSKDEKWRSYNIPNNYIWNLWRYKENSCETLFVCKSVKDDSVFSKIGRCAVSLQSEDAKIFLEHNVNNILKVSKNPIIVMGTDEQGFNTSLNITKTTKWKWFNVKKKYYTKYNCNDPAELVRVFSLKKLEQELKDKNL
jgi:hypothetical protein